MSSSGATHRDDIIKDLWRVEQEQHGFAEKTQDDEKLIIERLLRYGANPSYQKAVITASTVKNINLFDYAILEARTDLVKTILQNTSSRFKLNIDRALSIVMAAFHTHPHIQEYARIAIELGNYSKRSANVIRVFSYHQETNALVKAYCEKDQ